MRGTVRSKEFPMRRANLAVFVAVLAAATATGRSAPPLPEGATGRTAWGDPDLQGTWDFRTATPLERPATLAGKAVLSDAEAAEIERQADLRLGSDSPTLSVHAPYWLDYGTKVLGNKRSSLIVHPESGRLPAMTPEGQQRAARRAATARGPANSWEDRNSWERCITRGLPDSMLPGAYNNNVQIFQTPGHVAILMEMIHETRIVPLDGRPHLSDRMRQWQGDPRGRWERDTLVVETTNFTANAPYRGSSEHLRLTERYRRTAADTIDYEFTVSDASTWIEPWTVAFPMTRTDERVYEYACHEGNYGLQNMLRVQRVEDEKAGR
jgi:hypothetical protein